MPRKRLPYENRGRGPYFFQPTGARIGIQEYDKRKKQHGVGPIKAAVKYKAIGRPPMIFLGVFWFSKYLNLELRVVDRRGFPA
jgi:hypothetical protein